MLSHRFWKVSCEHQRIVRLRCDVFHMHNSSSMRVQIRYKAQAFKDSTRHHCRGGETGEPLVLIDWLDKQCIFGVRLMSTVSFGLDYLSRCH